jgi:hypothetical protein
MTTKTSTAITFTFHPTYGACPVCGAAGTARERRFTGGRDTCSNGHQYLSASAVYPVAK